MMWWMFLSVKLFDWCNVIGFCLCRCNVMVMVCVFFVMFRCRLLWWIWMKCEKVLMVLLMVGCFCMRRLIRLKVVSLLYLVRCSLKFLVLDVFVDILSSWCKLVVVMGVFGFLSVVSGSLVFCIICLGLRLSDWVILV